VEGLAVADNAWSRIVNSTIRKYLRQQEVNILRARKLSALLKKRGRITFNNSGTALDWKVKYKRVKMTPYADGDPQDFSRKDRHKTATIGWRGYTATDSMTKGEYLQNRSTEAIVKLYDDRTKSLIEDMEDQFGEEFYVDGNASGNSKSLHGVESFLSSFTKRAGKIAAQPTNTYAGLSNNPGDAGGTWSGTGGISTNDWPDGRGSANYDFWSPLIVDYTDSALGGTTWEANAVEALSFGIVHSQRSKSARGMLDLVLVDSAMWRAYKRIQRTKERIEIDRGSDSDLVKLGFKDVINQDGVDVTTEYGLPTGIGYGFNIDMMELCSQQGQVFVPEGPSEDIATKSWRYSVDFYGNMRCNPRYFVKFTS
jgi:hypothetical protein